MMPELHESHVLNLFVALSLAVGSFQDAASLQDESPENPSASVRVEQLRNRIHKMRMDLLLGGEKVVEAEAQAIDFYSGKVEMVEQRLDAIDADSTAKQAAYEVALDRALNGPSDQARRSSMVEAAQLRAELTAMDQEAAGLRSRSRQLSEMVRAVQARETERQKLAVQVETTGVDANGFNIPLPTVGLAPVVGSMEPASPLEDETLVNDLMSRDPLNARRILFQMDPVGYWLRFPLQPPADELRAALEFPSPDLPGHR